MGLKKTYRPLFALILQDWVYYCWAPITFVFFFSFVSTIFTNLIKLRLERKTLTVIFQVSLNVLYHYYNKVSDSTREILLEIQNSRQVLFSNVFDSCKQCKAVKNVINKQHSKLKRIK